MNKNNAKSNPREPPSVPVIMLKCSRDPKRKHKLNCQLESDSQQTITEEDLEDSATLTKKMVQYESIHPQKNTSKYMIIGILLTALSSGFGFAFAYFILYFLYDWSTNPAFQIDQIRFTISLVILIIVELIIILAAYYFAKRSLTSQKVEIKRRIDEPMKMH